jgi:hypothetical protein
VEGPRALTVYWRGGVECWIRERDRLATVFRKCQDVAACTSSRLQQLHETATFPKLTANLRGDRGRRVMRPDVLALALPIRPSAPSSDASSKPRFLHFVPSSSLHHRQQTKHYLTADSSPPMDESVFALRVEENRHIAGHPIWKTHSEYTERLGISRGHIHISWAVHLKSYLNSIRGKLECALQRRLRDH